MSKARPHATLRSGGQSEEGEVGPAGASRRWMFCPVALNSLTNARTSGIVARSPTNRPLGPMTAHAPSPSDRTTKPLSPGEQLVNVEDEDGRSGRAGHTVVAVPACVSFVVVVDQGDYVCHALIPCGNDRCFHAAIRVTGFSFP